MDTKEDKAIYVEMGKEGCMRFKQESVGLFVFDVRKGLVKYKNKSNKLQLDLYSFLQSVSDLKSNFTRSELDLAEKAKSLCKRIGSPPLRKFSKWLNGGLLDNCDVTSKDARRAKVIHGKEVVKLRGKATRPSQTAGITSVVTEVPRTLTNAHKT